MAATWSCVIFSRSFSTRSSSSVDRSPSFCIASSSWRALRRMLRTVTRPSSDFCFTTLTSSLRRCSVGTGNESRMTEPSLDGVMPRSEPWRAFSMAASELLSYGETTSRRASGTLKPAIWRSSVSVP